MKAVIRQRALELGFDDCRFTTAAAPASAEKFQDWLAQNNHGEMQWLERNAEKRVEPQNVLAGAKSMIVLAASYASFRSSRREEALTKNPGIETSLLTSAATNGVVARYAQFADYHDVLAEKLKSLTDFIASVADRQIRSLWYVDTGPILERDFAQRAGLGFVGKHTNLISRNGFSPARPAPVPASSESRKEKSSYRVCG